MSNVDRNPYTEALNRGCAVLEPKPNELFVDIDSEAGAQQFFVAAEILGRVYQLEAQAWPSPSREPWHHHVLVTLGTVTLTHSERISLQLMLGSDPVREALGWLRMLSNTEPVTVFFEKCLKIPHLEAQ